ncbi:YciI family protein [Phenylobacterium sp.]|uniref:YciI family protein n=1 Tax=Phenylobacterium sp. TaxID=1871053 RepID=UPI002ED94F88
MPFYAVVGLDHPPHSMALRDRVRPAHRAFVLQHDQMIRFATAMLDADGHQQGSIYVFEADDIDPVRAWTAEEPFCQAGVYRDLRVVEIAPALSRLPIIEWPA